MELKIGSAYETRDGKRVTISKCVHDYCIGELPHNNTIRYNSDGKVLGMDNSLHSYDIMHEWQFEIGSEYKMCSGEILKVVEYSGDRFKLENKNVSSWYEADGTYQWDGSKSAEINSYNTASKVINVTQEETNNIASNIKMSKFQAFIYSELDRFDKPKYLKTFSCTKDEWNNLNVNIVRTIKALKFNNTYNEETFKTQLMQKQQRYINDGHSGRMNINPFIEHLKKKLTKMLYENKKPIHEDVQYIGIECECFIPKNNIKRLEKDLFAIRHNVTIGDDGSLHWKNDCGCDDEECDECHGEYTAKEIKLIIPFGSWDILKTFCDILNDHEAEVNDTCGLHVHFDQRGYTTRQVSLNGGKLGRAMEHLIYMLPKDRRKNDYCHAIKNTINRGSRYAHVNMQAYKRFKTIEVRSHSGTTDYKKMLHWIKLIGYILKVKGSKTFSNIQDVIAKCIPENEIDLRDYVMARTLKFSPELFQPTLPVGEYKVQLANGHTFEVSPASSDNECPF